MFNIGDEVVLIKERDGLLPGSIGVVDRVHTNSTRPVAYITITDPAKGSVLYASKNAIWSVFFDQIAHLVDENAVFIEGDDDDDCV